MFFGMDELSTLWRDEVTFQQNTQNRNNVQIESLDLRCGEGSCLESGIPHAPNCDA